MIILFIIKNTVVNKFKTGSIKTDLTKTKNEAHFVRQILQENKHRRFLYETHFDWSTKTHKLDPSGSGYKKGDICQSAEL